MKLPHPRVLAALLFALPLPASAATRYVDVNSPNPTPPYTNWATAAKVIQNAVDAADPGDTVLVTNGVYQTGGRAVFGTMTNRVAVTRAITVQSVNGPAVTVLQGRQIAGTTNGNGAIRCVYLTNGAFLSGFTLTNGATRAIGDLQRDACGGGLWCAATNAMASNCVIVANSAAYGGAGTFGGTILDSVFVANRCNNGYGGGAFLGSVSNCSFTGNFAYYGGGSASNVLQNCSLTNNSAREGGGAYRASGSNCVFTGGSAMNGGGANGATLEHCLLISNTASLSGGGAYFGSLWQCVVSGNAAEVGGGTIRTVLTNCVLSNNAAVTTGGGAYYGALYGSLLTGNTAGSAGGGAAFAVANNCTFTGNSAALAGGVYSGLLTNCIVYFNSATTDGANYLGSSFQFCSTTPMPSSGVGNIPGDPLLTDAAHLSVNSPCRGAGLTIASSNADLDGEAWNSPPAIGCDEYSTIATGPLNVSVIPDYTNVAVSFPITFAAIIHGHASSSAWDFGDGVVVSNQPWTSHVWTSPGSYTVVLRAFNDTSPAGVIATSVVQVVTQPIHYVAAGNPGSVAPYSSWETAAATIQSALDSAFVPGSLILVTNGVYAEGGRPVSGALTNRVAVTLPLSLRSVNGPDVTVINGHWDATTNGDAAVRCVYLCTGASIEGFTLTNGATRSAGDSSLEQSGGGLWCQSLGAGASNCVIAGNSAGNYGGGAVRGSLTDCVLSQNSACIAGGAWEASMTRCRLDGNVATDEGGGALGGTLLNCTVTGNKSLGGLGGGGVYFGSLVNCLITHNSAAGWGGGAIYSTLKNCTVTGNDASDQGGGTYGGVLTNTIIYFNTAQFAPNYLGGTLGFCCTTPLPSEGDGNIDADPQMASFSHLSASSPCSGAGLGPASGLDIDGEPWGTPPSIGCDEFTPGTTSGALAVAIDATYTNVATETALSFAAIIEGRTTANWWDFGDGTTASNQPVVLHAWLAPGDYLVILRVFNDSYPDGISATTSVHAVTSPVHYVDSSSVNPVSPYTSWTTAATDIQSAVDAAWPGASVLVSNGVYASGGRAVHGTMTNRVAVTRPMMVHSVNGPGSSIIEGYQVPGMTNGDGAVRCVYLADGASLSGFTLTNGATRRAGDDAREQRGGGLWCQSTNAIASNCVLIANCAFDRGGGASFGRLIDCVIANNTASMGGGAFYSSLDHCVITNNWTTFSGGGGVMGGTLDFCTLVGNRGVSGGGAASAVLNFCTLTNNLASYFGGGAFSCTLNHCVLTGNSSPSQSGGGAYTSTLNHCVLLGNWAYYNGGGAHLSTMNNCVLQGNSGNAGGGSFGGTLNNCTLVGNSATTGGGCSGGTLNNCIVWSNAAGYMGPNFSGSVVNYSCTAPMPTNGIANFTNAPLFADANLRLQPNSPCINAGDNGYALSGVDFDGLPRIAAATVDVGAYELQSPSSVLSYAWAQQHGLLTDGSMDYADTDSDGLNNWQEWRAGTLPINALSVLRLRTPGKNASGIVLTWESVSDRSYFIDRSTNLGNEPAFLTLRSNVVGNAGTTTYTDTNAVGSGPFFYRVGVED